ncbi:uromodulin-like [Spea bombifrons]|uniref:uromodulin-like n=1 Tax=Spea bombifrons TaxID=233779 RepID=UPI00234B4E41|nr:uromodulin-like [Spea bombifrons]
MLLLGFVVLLATLEQTDSTSCYAGINGDPPKCSTCGGTCTAGTGCKCLSNTSFCLPDAGTCPMNSSVCCLSGLSWNQDLACCVEEPYCSPACLSDEICMLVNQSSTCSVNTTFYQNQNLSVYNVTGTVECKGSNMTVSLNKNLLDALYYKSFSSSLLDPSCTGGNVTLLNGQRLYSVIVPSSFGSCGNRMSKNTTHVTYTNTLHIYKNSGIVTLSNLSIQFSCTYNLTMQSALVTVLKPVMSSQDVSTGTSEGGATTTIAAYVNPSYTQPLPQTEQQQLPVGSTLYFGMSTQFLDPAFVLRVDSCFTTPTSDGSGPIKVQLIKGGCSANQGPYIEVVENGKSKEVRFSIVSFAFKGYDNVYIFCDARLCNAASGSCSGCSASREASDVLPTSQFSLGPFAFQDIENSGSYTAVSLAVLVGSLLSPWIL